MNLFLRLAKELQTWMFKDHLSQEQTDFFSRTNRPLPTCTDLYRSAAFLQVDFLGTFFQVPSSLKEDFFLKESRTF